MKRVARITLIAMALLLLVFGYASAQEKSGFAGSNFALPDEPRQVMLVNGLREISGLAMATEGSVYAHNDEHGIVYELSLSDGKVISAFALGDPTVAADFEGVAARGDRVYLITSTGLIYEALAGAHRSRVLFNVFNTGAGAFCEVEGLALASEDDAFFILCKTPQKPELQGKLIIYRWNLQDRRPVLNPWLQVLYSDFLDAEEARIFRPSAIEWDKEQEIFVIVSARSRQLIVMGKEGAVMAKRMLSTELHAQAEGVALTPEGDLVIADEGAGRGPGRLSLYTMQN